MQPKAPSTAVYDPSVPDVSIEWLERLGDYSMCLLALEKFLLPA